MVYREKLSKTFLILGISIDARVHRHEEEAISGMVRIRACHPPLRQRQRVCISDRRRDSHSLEDKLLSSSRERIQAQDNDRGWLSEDASSRRHLTRRGVVGLVA